MGFKLTKNPDSDRVSKHSKLVGNPFEHDQNRNWERATIIQVNPGTYTVDVYTERGKYLSGLSIPTSSYDPSSGAGEISMPKRGQVVAVHYELGDPILNLAVPFSSAGPPLQSIAANPVVPDIGGEDGVYAGQGTANYAGLRPQDVLPGDWMRIGSQGNLVGVLEGGVTVLKASELAQIIAVRTNDLLKLLGRNLEILTDFGEITFTNDNGNTSMSLRAGAKQTTESSPTQEYWTIRADLGDAGNLVNFRITDTQGHTLSGVQMDPNGSVTRTTTGDLTEIIGGAYNMQFGGDVGLVIPGNKNDTVNGDSTESITGSKTINAGSTITLQSGVDTVVSPTRDLNISTGRNINISASGNPLATPGATTLSYTITNGSVVFDIGDPAAGDLQAAMSGMQVNTFLGNIGFDTKLGNFIVNTTIPNSVQLGGQAPLFHSMLFEMFEAFMETLGSLIDSHTHLTPSGPSGPPIVPPYETSESLVPGIQSEYVTHGG